jgi:ribosomal protein S18 acetylase RimI-like enzyme
LKRFAREIWTQHYTPIIGKAQVEYMLDQFQSRKAIAADIASGYVYSLAYAGGQACGYSAVRFDPDALFLSKLYVSETFRGRGIARALLRAAEETARKRGLACIRLICNKHNASSLAAYARMGFSRVADVVTDIGGGFVMDDYVMEKTLPEQ